ncbi:T9SS type A sorting domain-containing protein [candidate division KSB1 bacterium]|nr:T9SS type A sorting domain-containing protein [candidate division KSB1 bacterium]
MRIITITSLIILLCGFTSYAQQWQSFTSETSGLPSNQVFSIDFDEFGTMWFGTDSGVTAYDGFSWYTYTVSNGLADHQVNDFIITSGPELWLATGNGISTMRVPAFDAVLIAIPFRVENTKLLSNKINALTIDSGNLLWFGTDSGVTVFTGREWISTSKQGVVLRHDVMAMDVSPDDLVYCGTEGGGIARLKLSNLDVITGASTIERPWAPMPIDSVYAIYIGKDSLQWFGTSQGLFQHRGINSKKNWKLFTLAHGLPHRHVQAIIEDARGKIWVGTRGGVACIQKDLSAHVNYSIADGLVNNDVRDVVADADSSIWFATAGGVSRFAPKTNVVKAPESKIAPCFGQIAIYPNPFNICTSIEFRLIQSAYMKIAIYNLSGQQIRTLLNGFVNGGMHVVHWDGRDHRNGVVSTGVYVARFMSGTQLIHKKLLVLK